MKANTIADMAWAAGLIDGEGCFSVVPRRRSFHIYLRVVLSDRPENYEALLRLRSILGGKITNRKRQKSWRNGSLPQLQWKLWQTELFQLLNDLMQFLVIKRHAAESIFRIKSLMIGAPQHYTIETVRGILEIRDGMNRRSLSRHPRYRNANTLIREMISSGRFN